MNLNDMLQSDEYMAWHSDLMSDICYNDPDRDTRCFKAANAKEGADGSFHAEVMNDWLHFLEYESQDIGVKDIDYHKIYIEILECWDWHDKEGTLYDEVG